MKVYYRISDSGYNKVKPDYISNENCYNNFINNFKHPNEVILIADNVSDVTWSWCQNMRDRDGLLEIHRTNGGSSGKGFNICYDMAIQHDDDEIIFFVENDYIFVDGIYDFMLEAFYFGIEYLTPYLHPDKFIPASQGGNVLVDDDGGQVTKVFNTGSRFWMLTDSTTMTFASTVGVLKQDMDIIKAFTSEPYPNDCKMFHSLRDKGRSLAQPIPTLATHGETSWMASTIGLHTNNWEDIIYGK